MTIYQRRSLIRLVNTKNTKSGLYKIQITHQELLKLTIKQIKGLAKNQRDIKELKDLIENNPDKFLDEHIPFLKKKL